MAEMDSDQLRIAMIEITNDKMEGSLLKDEFPEQYDRLVAEITVIKDSGNIIEIPPEVP